MANIKILSFSVLFSFFIPSCKLYKHGYVVTEKNLPDTFRIELPLRIDHKNYFCIKARINDAKEQDFIIDTKAPTMIKQDDTAQLKISYWGNQPWEKAINAYGQKAKIHWCYFDSIAIQSLCFVEPLFLVILPDERIYQLMYKNVLGHSILECANWKFAIDDSVMIVFSKKDTALLRKETEGYTKIKKGLNDDGVRLKISQLPKEYKFMCDLGCQGEIVVNKSIFKNLSKKYPYRKIVRDNYPLENDTAYLFENITVQWDSMSIPNLRVTHISSINLNLVGTEFMQRFNFVLRPTRLHDYSRKDVLDIHQHLFIKPVKNFENIKSEPYISSFGFNIAKENYIKVSAIEVGSIADRAGLQAGDRVISIDGGAFALDTEYVNHNLIDYLADKNTVSLQIERQGKAMEIKLVK